MRSGEREEGRGGAIEAASTCSICLEAVMTGGRRSTVRLQCSHEFHLDCLGSAFNAKGMMQCPNCRNVENGNWLYGNDNSLLSSVSTDEWTHDDELYTDEWTHDDELYELNFLEMPYTIRWCPVNRIGRVTSSFENADSFPSVAFQGFVGHNIITELPPISVPSHPCPHLSGFHQVQPASAPTFHANSNTITDTSLYHPQWSQVSDSDEVSSMRLRNSEAHYYGWDRYQSTYSHPRDIAAASTQASISRAAPPLNIAIEDGGPPRGAGSVSYSFNGRHGSQALPVHPHPNSSNRTPVRTHELHRQTNITLDQWLSQNSTDPPFAGRQTNITLDQWLSQNSTDPPFASRQTNITLEQWLSQNSTDRPFAGRSIWPPSNHVALYMYPFPPSFNISIVDVTNTGAEFPRSGVQFVPFAAQIGSMEYSSRSGFHGTNLSSERRIAQARLENSLHGSSIVRSPYF